MACARAQDGGGDVGGSQVCGADEQRLADFDKNAAILIGERNAIERTARDKRIGDKVIKIFRGEAAQVEDASAVGFENRPSVAAHLSRMRPKPPR